MGKNAIPSSNPKGGLISESFSIWLKSPKKGAHGCDLEPFFFEI